jgi:hypothetical protein
VQLCNAAIRDSCVRRPQRVRARRTTAIMLVDQKPPGIAAMARGARRKRDFVTDIMVALAAAIALTVLYVNVVVTWARGAGARK